MVKKVIVAASRGISGVIYFLIVIAAFITLVPLAMGYKPVAVLSGSMEPAYPVGSIIYYQAADFEEIEKGDAITFRLGGGALATHRVIQKDEEKQEFITKGDNNSTVDTAPVSAEAVVGKVGEVVIPYAGFVGIYIKEIPVIFIVGALLMICSILSPEKKCSDMKEGQEGKRICKQ